MVKTDKKTLKTGRSPVEVGDRIGMESGDTVGSDIFKGKH